MDRHLAVLTVLLLSFPALPALQHPVPVRCGAGGTPTFQAPVQDPATALAAAAAMVDDNGILPGNLFIENAGQLQDGSVRFYSTGRVSADFTDTGVVYRVLGAGSGQGEGTGETAYAGDGATDGGQVGSAPARNEPPPPGTGSVSIYRMEFAGARSVRPEGFLPSSCPNNFFLGNDPARWRADIRSFGEVLYRDLYDGIDLAFIPIGGGIKYQFTVHPGGDPRDIRLRFEGATPSAAGDSLLLDTPAGRVRDSGLAVYQELARGRRAVEATLAVDGNVVSYDVGRYDLSLPLVIDPIVYSTVLGGGKADYAMAVAVDYYRDVYVTGETLSPDFPTTQYAFENNSKIGAQDPTFDIFVLKLAPNGSRAVYSTFIGSSKDDYAHAIRVDGSGAAYVTGNTLEFDFPVTNGSFDPSFNGITDAFVLKLSPSGARLVYSTFIGGESEEHGYALAVNPDGTAIAAGSTDSADMPTTAGAFQTSIRTGASLEDAFVCELSASGSGLEYCTYIGGVGSDYVLAAQAGADGSAFLTGATDSFDFPVTAGAYDGRLNGQDAYVTELNADGSDIVYSTLLGGGDTDTGMALALDDSGEAYVAGVTVSQSFPVTRGVAGAAYAGFQDCFVSKLDAAGDALLLSTYIGGGKDDTAAGIQLDDSGNVYLAGTTDSPDFPTTPAAENRSLQGGDDLFLAKLDPGFGHILYSTYIGGKGDDICGGVALDAERCAYLAGTISSSDFPGGLNSSRNGDDVFIMKLGLVSVPTAPSISVGTGHHTATATWQKPELGDPILGYVLYRGTGSGVPDISWRLGPDQLSFHNGGLENGVNYYYEVQAFNSSGDGELSVAARAMPGLRPSAPKDLAGWPGPGRVRLDWGPPELTYDLPVTGYRIFRGGAGNPDALLAVTNSTSYEDDEVDNGFTYSYMVCACNIIGQGDQSDVVAVTPSEVPSMPANLTGYLNGRTVTLSWDTPVNPGAYPITDYHVYRSFEGGRAGLVGSTEVRICHDEHLGAGNYSYRVVANTTAGEGYSTGEVDITILNLPPVAGFRVDPLEGNSTDPFVFTSTSFDIDVGIVNYTWNLGDGTRAFSEDPTHYYPRRGVYNITLRIRDSDGAVAISTGAVEVLNTAPSIMAPLPQRDITVTRGSGRTFSIVPSDPDDDALIVSWYLNGTAVGTGNRTKLKFPELGLYQVKAALSDGEASVATAWNVTVVPPPPPPPVQFPWRWALGALLAAGFIAGVYFSVRRRPVGTKASVSGTGPGPEEPRPSKKTVPVRKVPATRMTDHRLEPARPPARKARHPVTYGATGIKAGKKQTVGDIIHRGEKRKGKKGRWRAGR